MTAATAISAHGSMLRELEATIRTGTPNQRITYLRRVTDLFLSAASKYDEEQVAIFDDVIGQLAAEIEESALAELSSRLAPVPNAPAGVVRMLAKDDAISVAGPVLEQSARLDENDLLDVARSRGQQHLIAISGRPRLSERLTDVLVERGDDEVARKVAGNDGAAFSDTGFSKLVDRAGSNETLAEAVGQRPDIPPHLFHTLVVRATERVQQRLLAGATPEMQPAIRHLIEEISGRLHANPESASSRYAAARSYVQVLAQSGKLVTARLLEFANEGRFEDSVAGLAELASVPLDIVDRVMHGDGLDPFFVLCKANGFDWSLVRALILIRRSCRRLSPQELAQACQDYNLLSRSTADRVLRFWQIRQTG